MELNSDIKLIDLCLYLPKHETLVLTDLHLGYEEALNKQGVAIPRFQFDDLISRLRPTLERLKISRFIILGDLKHEFQTISNLEFKQVNRFIGFLKHYSPEIILIKGNHDTILGPFQDKIKVVDYFKLEHFFFCHGDKVYDNPDFQDSKYVIFGHEHPAVTLNNHGHKEKFKCFLVGNYKDKVAIVLPSFNLVTEGTDILTQPLLSPYLDNISDFKVYIVFDNNILDFGTVNLLQEL